MGVTSRTIMNETVQLTFSEGIATVTLNRPERLNAMSPELLEGLFDSLTIANEDPAVRVVIVTGAGRAFSAGGDLKGISAGRVGGSSESDPFAARVALLRERMRSAELLMSMPKATVAQINGPCAGAGLALACACDLRYCADSAVFNTAFLTAGLSGDFGATWTLPRIVGPAKARELFLLSERFGGPEAERLGLVTRSVPDDRLADEVRGAASRLASVAPLTFAALKQNLVDSAAAAFGDQLDREAERQIRCSLTEDTREAARALLEKRPAIFKGR